MNKRQLEVQKRGAAEEAKVIRRLKLVYSQAQDDCANKIIELSKRTDLENLQTIIYQKKYQEAIKKQLDAVLEDLHNKEFSTIAEYLNVSYENGFFGTLYDLQGQGIPLCFPIDQEQVVQAIQTDTKLSNGLYNKLSEDTQKMKKSIKVEISRCIANGESWNQAARYIAIGMNNPFKKSYNNAIRIARTEGHRIQNQATLHCQQRAKAKGAEVVKQWDSTLDGITRPTHKELDGQIREVEELFEVAGKKAMYPGNFNNPSEDCNCRCSLLQRAKWGLEDELDYTKWDGDKNELVTIKSKGYNEFKNDANLHLMKMQFPSDVYKIKGLTPRVKEELETALLKLKAEYDIRLNSISVEKAGRNDIFIVGYHDGVMDMAINENADFKKILKKIPEQYELGHFAGKSLEDYMAHEMAHVMMYQDCTSDMTYHAKYKQVESLYDSLRGVSRYADKTQSGNEALAEAFVRVRNNENVSPIVKILVESYYGKWKK